jgi:hypothetical protein
LANCRQPFPYRLPLALQIVLPESSFSDTAMEVDKDATNGRSASSKSSSCNAKSSGPGGSPRTLKLYSLD